MSFQTGTATDYLDLLAKLSLYCTGNRCSAVAIVGGGTGYTVGDVLSVTGGTGTFVTTLKVTSVAGGVIDGVKVWTSGAYTVNPTNAVAVTGGTGTGATFNLTFISGGWTEHRNATYATTEKELILEGVGSGSDEVFVGIRTYRDTGSDAFNWELAGFTGFSSALAWSLQPGISPGRWDSATPLTEGGAFVPLDDASFPFWFNVTGRRIIVIARPGTSYVQMYLGFLDPFNTTTEWPYPMIVAGCCNQKETRFNSSRACLNSLIQPTGKTGVTNAPVMVRHMDGTWQNITNFLESSGGASSNRAVSLGKNVIPPCNGTLTPSEAADNMFLGTSIRWDDIIPQTLGGTPTFEMRGVPSTPTNEVCLFPTTIMFTVQPDFQILGQYNDVFWAPIAGSSLANEDEVTIGVDTYVLFQGVNNGNSYDFIALKRSF